jgi:glycosyltransferase involved in cell wall biosynthesis
METFGIAALEAMSVGRPTIFTRLGPGPELIQDRETGLLCDPRDTADLARVLSQLLDDREAAEALGRRGRARVLSGFDKRDWIARNVAFFESCSVLPG